MANYDWGRHLPNDNADLILHNNNADLILPNDNAGCCFRVAQPRPTRRQHAALGRRDAASRDKARQRLHVERHLERRRRRDLVDGRAHSRARVGRDG